VLAGDAQGRSGYEAELKLQITAGGLEQAVVIAGHVNDMAAAYLASDIVVSASTDPEAFGRVAAEAGAMERPVIATDHGGAREIILPDRSGFLVPPGNSAALAHALGALVAAGPDRRAAMGKAARAHVALHYTVGRMCADTLKLYRNMLGDRT
jgi:glycosyltransferase involved in cell wall biosynthesis